MSEGGNVGERPRVAVLLQPEWRGRLLSETAEANLAAIAEVVDNGTEDIGPSDLPRLLDNAVACLTGWRTPPFSVELVASCRSLRLIAHTAGTIRKLIPASAFAQGIRVTHAVSAMARAVAEHILTQALLCVQHLHADDRAMHDGGGWETGKWLLDRRLLGNRTVGIWGMGHVGRASARLLAAVGCSVLASDPTVSERDMRAIGVTLVPLPALFERTDVLIVAAPILEATIGVINADLLARLHDGAIFINSGRAVLVDEPALLRELESGRISAALDVFYEEPLPHDSPLRRMRNVLLSPHVAGHTLDTHRAQGEQMVDEVRRMLRGEPLLYEVTPDEVERIA